MLAIKTGLRAGRAISVNTRLQSHSTLSKLTDFFSPKLTKESTVPLVGQDGQRYKSVAAYCDGEYGGGSASKCDEVTSGDEKFIRWEADLQFDDQHADATKTRAGYVALNFAFEPPIDLLDFDSYDLEIRSNKDVSLAMSMICKSFVPKASYQFLFNLKASQEFTKVNAPFEYFKLTEGGKDRMTDKANDYLLVQSLGFLTTTDQSPTGDFVLDVKSIVVTTR